MMRRFGFILFTLFLFAMPCFADFTGGENLAESTKIFIYHIPDNEPENINPDQTKKVDIQQPDIISDDITADTSQTTTIEDNHFENDNDEIELVQMHDYEIDDMYTDILKGYATYNEEDANAISLDDSIVDFLAIKIQQPYNYKGGKYLASKSLRPIIYSKFSNMEYSIAPISTQNSKKIGRFTTGAMFDQGIDYAELEQSTGVFSRYDTKYFAIYTAYSRTLNSTNSNYNDNFYLSPELKLNQYFTIKQILSADITKNRKKAEIVLSINPFGQKDTDRMHINIGANATYDDTNSLLKNQFKFSTNFKF